ncbi:hypothetical protein XELAEV_18008024mg [Xenopus laevis]|uniref:CCHC-type domain-containing protein n=1 Tax=Xenopus laevis TaxID=8355 RepID=A0A974E304_XENLA|nr:hypothetical protein XELAEV_18008024mg [Xenopus laevis]
MMALQKLSPHFASVSEVEVCPSPVAPVPISSPEVPTALLTISAPSDNYLCTSGQLRHRPPAAQPRVDTDQRSQAATPPGGNDRQLPVADLHPVAQISALLGQDKVNICEDSNVIIADNVCDTDVMFDDFEVEFPAVQHQRVEENAASHRVSSDMPVSAHLHVHPTNHTDHIASSMPAPRGSIVAASGQPVDKSLAVEPAPQPQPVIPAAVRQNTGVGPQPQPVSAPQPTVNAWATNRLKQTATDPPLFASSGPTSTRRNAVKLRWISPMDECPDRDFVVEDLLKASMQFKVDDQVWAVIKQGDREFDISFKLPEYLDVFLSMHNIKREYDIWKGFRAVPLTKLHCDVVSPLQRCLDLNGVWDGSFKVTVTLRMRGHAPVHLPNTFFIGKDRGVIFYVGQPKLCFRCGSLGHYAAT